MGGRVPPALVALDFSCLGQEAPLLWVQVALPVPFPAFRQSHRAIELLLGGRGCRGWSFPFWWLGPRVREWVRAMVARQQWEVSKVAWEGRAVVGCTVSGTRHFSSTR